VICLDEAETSSVSLAAADCLAAYSRAEQIVSLPFQRQRWPPLGIAVRRATPPLPLPLTHTTPLAPNRTTKDTTTTAPRTLTLTARLMSRTTAFTTTRTENAITIKMVMILTVRYPLEPFAARRNPSSHFLNLIQTLIQKTTSTVNATNHRLNRLLPLGWGSPISQQQQ
jgi:hypothetical protein